MQQNDQVSPQEAIRQQRLVQEMDAAWRKKFAEYKHDLELRKWCVDMAIKSNSEPMRVADVAYLIWQFLDSAYELPQELPEEPPSL